MSLQCTTPGLFNEWPEEQELDVDSQDVNSEDEGSKDEIKKNHKVSMENFISINQ